MNRASPRRGLCRLWLAALCTIVPVRATAATDAGAGLAAPYSLQVSQQTLLEVLQRFASEHGLTLHATDDTKGGWKAVPLDGWVRAATGRAFLEQLAHAHHFSWFVADRTLHVGAARDSAVERIALHGARADSARAALEAVGIFDARFGWGELAGQDAVLVNGPRAYRALVRRFLKTQPAGQDVQPELEPMIFPLRFTRAGDTAQAGNAAYPGVATLLRRLLTPAAPVTPPFFSLPSQPDLLPPLPGTASAIGQGIGYAAPPTLPVRETHPFVARNASASSKVAPVGIVADEGTNSVIVWGAPVWRTAIERIVEALDRPAPLVSMDVFVIESDLPTVASLSVTNETTLAQSAAEPPTFGDRLAQSVSEHRARLINHQTLVGRVNAHATLGIGAEVSHTGSPPHPDAAEPANDRSGNRSDRVDLIARIVPSPKPGATVIAVDVDLLMTQPTGLPGQTWANTSSVKLDTRVTLESGAPPKLIASYPVATARSEQRAIFISAKAL